jgi:hypothetical protein
LAEIATTFSYGGFCSLYILVRFNKWNISNFVWKSVFPASYDGTVTSL